MANQGVLPFDWQNRTNLAPEVVSSRQAGRDFIDSLGSDSMAALERLVVWVNSRNPKYGDTMCVTPGKVDMQADREFLTWYLELLIVAELTEHGRINRK